MKVAYCKYEQCQERCMSRWASVICVAIGAIAVGGLSAAKLGYVKATLNLSEYANQEFYLAVGAILLATLLAIFFSLFERFEHYITAIVFGVSVPGLIYALANLGAVQ